MYIRNNKIVMRLLLSIQCILTFFRAMLVLTAYFITHLKFSLADLKLILANSTGFNNEVH